jgi:hypothetical protein
VAHVASLGMLDRQRCLLYGTCSPESLPGTVQLGPWVTSPPCCNGQSQRWLNTGSAKSLPTPRAGCHPNRPEYANARACLRAWGTSTHAALAGPSGGSRIPPSGTRNPLPCGVMSSSSQTRQRSSALTRMGHINRSTLTHPERDAPARRTDAPLMSEYESGASVANGQNRLSLNSS